MSAEVTASMVDYFTLTSPVMAGEDELWQVVGKTLTWLNNGLKRRPWKFFGYAGFYFTGKNLGHFAYGESQNSDMGVIVQASGMLAERTIDRFLGAKARWTRLDLAVDCKPAPPEQDVALNSYAKALILDKKRKYSLIVNSLAGQTMYVGARQNDQMGRLYDKSIELSEHNQPGSLWRYEVELKGERAKKAVREILSLSTSGVYRSSAITAFVYDFFEKRSVFPIFSRSSGEGLDLKLEAFAPDDERRLVWLRKQIKPAIKEMLADGNIEVLEALGILDFFNVSPKREKRHNQNKNVSRETLV